MQNKKKSICSIIRLSDPPTQGPALTEVLRLLDNNFFARALKTANEHRAQNLNLTKS